MSDGKRNIKSWARLISFHLGVLIAGVFCLVATILYMKRFVNLTAWQSDAEAARKLTLIN